jgi:glutaredoxin 2
MELVYPAVQTKRSQIQVYANHVILPAQYVTAVQITIVKLVQLFSNLVEHNVLTNAILVNTKIPQHNNVLIVTSLAFHAQVLKYAHNVHKTQFCKLMANV